MKEESGRERSEWMREGKKSRARKGMKDKDGDEKVRKEK